MSHLTRISEAKILDHLRPVPEKKKEKKLGQINEIIKKDEEKINQLEALRGEQLESINQTKELENKLDLNIKARQTKQKRSIEQGKPFKTILTNIHEEIKIIDRILEELKKTFNYETEDLLLDLEVTFSLFEKIIKSYERLDPFKKFCSELKTKITKLLGLYMFIVRKEIDHIKKNTSSLEFSSQISKKLYELAKQRNEITTMISATRMDIKAYQKEYGGLDIKANLKYLETSVGALITYSDQRIRIAMHVLEEVDNEETKYYKILENMKKNIEKIIQNNNFDPKTADEKRKFFNTKIENIQSSTLKVTYREPLVKKVEEEIRKTEKKEIKIQNREIKTLTRSKRFLQKAAKFLGGLMLWSSLTFGASNISTETVQKPAIEHVMSKKDIDDIRKISNESKNETNDILLQKIVFPKGKIANWYNEDSVINLIEKFKKKFPKENITPAKLLELAAKEYEGVSWNNSKWSWGKMNSLLCTALIAKALWRAGFLKTGDNSGLAQISANRLDLEIGEAFDKGENSLAGRRLRGSAGFIADYGYGNMVLNPFKKDVTLNDLKNLKPGTLLQYYYLSHGNLLGHSVIILGKVHGTKYTYRVYGSHAGFKGVSTMNLNLSKLRIPKNNILSESLKDLKEKYPDKFKNARNPNENIFGKYFMFAAQLDSFPKDWTFKIPK